MINVENLSEAIALKISSNLSTVHDKEVLAYGAFILIQTVLSIITIALFGIIFDVFIEALTISFAASILRKFSGGAHATSAINCAFIGMIVFGTLAIFVKHLLIKVDIIYLVIITIISFLLVFYIMYKYSPVGTATKPLINENIRKRLKKKSIKFTLSLFIANITLLFLYLHLKQNILLNFTICITVGAVWQSITLVSLGHKIIDLLDKVLGGTKKFIRRTNK